MFELLRRLILAITSIIPIGFAIDWHVLPEPPPPAQVDSAAVSDNCPRIVHDLADQHKVPEEWTIVCDIQNHSVKGMVEYKKHLITIRTATAEVICHEFGHAFDISRMTDSERQRWADARGYSMPSGWWPGSGQSDFESPAGDFAEAFAEIKCGDPSRSLLAGAVTAEQRDLLNEMIWK